MGKVMFRHVSVCLSVNTEGVHHPVPGRGSTPIQLKGGTSIQLMGVPHPVLMGGTPMQPMGESLIQLTGGYPHQVSMGGVPQPGQDGIASLALLLAECSPPPAQIRAGWGYPQETEELSLPGQDGEPSLQETEQHIEYLLCGGRCALAGDFLVNSIFTKYYSVN